MQATRRCTQVKHTEKLNRYASCSTTGQKFQIGHSVSSQLGLMTQSIREAKSSVHYVMEKLTLCILFSLQYKYPLYPQKIESFRKKFERETLEKTRLTHPQSSSFDSPNSSTLTFSIVTFLSGTLIKTFSHHTYICEKAILVLGKQLGRD